MSSLITLEAAARIRSAVTIGALTWKVSDAIAAETTRSILGRTKFTTSGAYDVIAITSLQKNDLCTEKLRDKTKSPDEISLPLRKAIVYSLSR